MATLLSPESRRLFTDCFRPPPGGTLDCAVGTTFTLDFEAFLHVPLALASGGFEAPAAALRDRVALLQGIQAVSHRFTVFCHDGNSNAPEIRHPLLPLLEDSYAPASARADGAIFHPKLWLIRFVSREDDSVLLRAVVLSRNLTTSRCWDTLVGLEGTPRGQRPIPESAGLARLVSALPGLMVGPPLSASRLEQINSLAADAARTEFFAPPPFDDAARVEFVALGLGDRARWSPTAGDRVLGISPFLSDGALRKLAALAPTRHLISREESLDRLQKETLADWQASHLVDTAGADAESAELEALGETSDRLPHGLHAKALAIDSGRRTSWWLGSANLTDSAMNGTNVELMIRLEGSRKDVGIETFLNGGFSTFTRVYIPPEESPPVPDDEAARSLAERARAALISATLRGECTPDDDTPGTWSVRVSASLSLPHGVHIEAWPLTLADTAALPWNADGVTFKGLSIESLTAFFAFRVEAVIGAERHRLAFTRKVPVSGFPEDRRQRIIRSVIRDRDSFISYLRRALAGVEGSPSLGDSGGSDPIGLQSARGHLAAQPLLLENMIRVLRRDPRRLVTIGHTVRGLLDGAGGTADEVVPADFLRIWKVIGELLPELDIAPDPSAPTTPRSRGRS